MTSNDQIDISHFDQPLAVLREHVEALHIRLDNFASGKNGQLVGRQTRDAVYDALQGVDQGLAEMRRLRAIDAPRLRGHVTAAMRDELSRANKLVEKITRANRQIFEDASEKAFNYLRHRNLADLVGELQMILTRLDHEMTTSGLPTDELQPIRYKAVAGPTASLALRKIFAVLISRRGARFPFWQNRVSR